MENEFVSPFQWKGNIKRVEYRRFHVCDEKTLESSELEFNENGQIIKCVESQYGRVERTATYEYNDKKQLIKKKEKSFFGVVDEVTEFIYNSEGSLTEKVAYFNSKIKHDDVESEFNSRVVYEYNSEGKLIKEYKYRGDEFRGENVYVYDENGRVKEIHYGGNWGDYAPSVRFFTYNSKGDIESIRQCEDATKLDEYLELTKFEYDAEGKVTLRTNYPYYRVAISYKDEDHNEYITYSYDDHGNVISAQEKIGGEISYKEEWKIEYR